MKLRPVEKPKVATVKPKLPRIPPLNFWASPEAWQRAVERLQKFTAKRPEDPPLVGVGRRAFLATVGLFCAANFSDAVARHSLISIPVPANYFVSPAGNDANDGKSISTPWQTLSKVNSSTFQPLDVVAFLGGQTFSGTLSIQSGGSVLGVLKFTAYGVGKATIASTIGNNGIQAVDKGYLTIDNFIVTGTNSGSAGVGILTSQTSVNVNNIIVSNCDVSLFPDSGIMHTAGTKIINGYTVDGCTATSCAFGVINGTAGIRCRGTYGASARSAYNCFNVLFRNSTVSHNFGANGTTSHCGSGFLMTQTNGGLGQGLVADDNGKNCNNVSGPTGIWVADSIGVSYVACESKNTKTGSGDGGGFDIDGGCTNCSVIGCYAHDNVGFGLLNFMYDDPTNILDNSGNYFAFNIAQRNGAGGMKVSSGGTRANTGQAYCNTVYSVGGAPAFRADHNGGNLNFTIASNIFVNSSSLVVQTGSTHNPSGVLMRGNDYWGVGGTTQFQWFGTTYGTYALWRAGTGQETIAAADVGFNVDPLLVSTGGTTAASYKITGSSTLLNNGLNLLTNFGINVGTTDYFGSTISSAGPYGVGASWVP